MAYQYVAYSSDRRLIEGKIEATSEATAELSLEQAGLRVLSLRPLRGKLTFQEAFPSLSRIKVGRVAQFLKSLATLLECGIPLLTALQMQEEGESHPAFKKVVSALMADLNGGSSFAEALGRHPQVFPSIYRQVIAARERMGNLETVLRQTAEQMEKRELLSKKLRQAMVYPAMVSLMAVAVVVVLVTVALPPILEVLTGMGVTLPLPTRVLLGLVGLFQSHPAELFLGIGITVAGVAFYLRRPSGRRQRDRFLLRAPLLGRIGMVAELSRLTRTLSVLLEAGLPLPEALDLARETVGNGELKAAVKKVQEEATQGEGLHRPMARTGMFPSFLVNIVRVGEETGTLGTTLATVADAYEREAEEGVAGLTALMEPLITLGIAMLVGFIALSVIMPIYSLMGKMG